LQKALVQAVHSYFDPANNSTQVTISMASYPGGSKCFLHCLYHSLLELLIFLVIIFCGIKMRNFVADASRTIKAGGGLSRQMAETNRQLTYTLLLQAILPLVAVLIGALCAFICLSSYLVSSYQSFYFIAYLTLPVPLIPVLNPLITILVVKQYRQYLLWRLGGKKTETSTIMTTTVVVNRSQSQRLSNSNQHEPITPSLRRHTMVA
jgi:hypothetical protein